MWVVIFFVLLIGFGVPVGFSMALNSVGYILYTGSTGLTMVPQAMISGVSSYTMLAIPFFMLVGELMNSSGITKRIFRFASCLVGHVTGGLGHVNVLSSMIFAGMSGAAVADCAGLGVIEIKAMRDAGFDTDFSVGVTAASSIIGPIIPPSSPMVLFGIAGSVSIGSLFMGGITAGILVGLVMMITVYVIARRRNYPKNPPANFSQIINAFGAALPALLSPIILVGGILSGYFTPTEAAAVAVFYSLFVGLFVYRELKPRDIVRVLTIGIENLGMVMLLMATGKAFAWVLGMEKIAEAATGAMFGISSSPWIIILLINLLWLFMGTFMETNASILILTPILMPIAAQIGWHPVHFGVTMIFALMIGLLTPPMAICLFITSKIGGISFQRAFKAVTPYYIGLLVVLFLINVFPEIVLAVPRFLLGTAF
ncbi:MAG: TRAP transporter large permease [Planctomycetota bacterium]|jgi:tripartite ATP-independent transporter DctM subunit|nr:TRAP transporter large permease [Planctomycetota bacterium]